MSEIDQMLREAFNEECRNIERYLAFAKKAEAEGWPQIARLFRATAGSERAHARAELRILGEVHSTLQNLQDAIDTEEKEFQEVYPRFLREAMQEGGGEPAALLRRILVVERTHHNLYQQALAALQGGADFPEAPVRVCRECGHTIIGDPPATCPVCGSTKEEFAEVP